MRFAAAYGSRFITSTKKAFMGPSSSLTLQMHRAFNSVCYKELLNLENFMFTSQIIKRKYILGRILFNVVPSSQVHQHSAVLYIKCVPHRNAWAEKNRKKRGGVLMELAKSLKRELKYGLNFGTSLHLIKTIYHWFIIDKKNCLQTVSVAATWGTRKK